MSLEEESGIILEHRQPSLATSPAAVDTLPTSSIDTIDSTSTRQDDDKEKTPLSSASETATAAVPLASQNQKKKRPVIPRRKRPLSHYLHDKRLRDIYRNQRRQDQQTSLCFMMGGSATVLILALLLLVYTRSALAGDYLYHGHEDTSPIQDFVLDKEQRDSETMFMPPYLNSTNHGPMVVEFYAPWCPHCQHFKPKYIQAAREVQATPEGKNVIFHAVSCTVHRKVCSAMMVKGYPTIKLFKAGSPTGIPSKRAALPADFVLEKLGLKEKEEPSVTKTNHKAHVDLGVIKSEAEEDNKKESPEKNQQPPPTKKEYPHRTQSELLSDAASSFEFALHHSIYLAVDKAMLSEERSAFKNWLMLLVRTLPRTTGPQMKLAHAQLTDLLQNFDQVVLGEKEYIKILDESNPNADKKVDPTWSPECTQGGDPHKGYTCGLWTLFHLMTIGVVEYNSRQDEYTDMISTLDAANHLRDYVLRFFACEECRKNFVTSYDNCDFGRCTRLGQDADSTTIEHWKELPLWLWEVHNSVNVRLQKEKAEREHQPVPTAKDQWKVRWPSREACPRCWTSSMEDAASVTWDKDAVYEFLKSEFWPKGELLENAGPSEEQHEEQEKTAETRRSSLLRRGLGKDKQSGTSSLSTFESGILITFAIVLNILLFVWYLFVRKKYEMNNTARGKKQ